MVTIPPGSSLGRYRIIEQLGKGGMATVFRCLDPNLDRYVAVKVLPSFQQEDPTFTARFSQEARTIAALTHPNILAIYDFGEDKGFLYLVSELLPGGDLQDKLTGKPLPPAEVLKYMGPLAEALDYAHGQGIVHGDIKPANVFLDAEGRPILADFGLARMLESATRFTLAQQAIGTPEYMAPEQAMGADADHRSDLYAFGIIIYQMMVGHTPFRADTPAATLMAHVHKTLPLPSLVNPNIEPRLEATLVKALAKEPDERFQSGKELIHAIEVACGLATADPISVDDMSATAVMDASQLQGADSMDAPTAVLGTEAALQAGDAAAAQAGVAGEALPKRLVNRGVMMIGGGVVALIAVVAVAALIFAGGGDAPEQVGTAPAGSVPASPGAPDSAAAPGAGAPTEEVAAALPADAAPAMNLAEAVAALDKIKTRAEANVLSLRGVTLEGEITSEFKTGDQLEAITRGFYRRESLREQVFEAEQLYKVLGLMTEEENLEEILLGIQLQQVAALFDDESEKVYVISEATSIGAVEEIGIVAAYMGGVQQALFDTFELSKRARLEDADQFRAAGALIKGDVFQVIQGYITNHFTPDQFDELSKPLPGNLLLQAPDVVQKANRFPQRDGQNFVARLFDDGGWEGVNAAYSNPPLSTEQILHPDKYFAGEEPRRTTMPNFADQMGKGWEEVGANTLVEFLLRTYLEQHLDDNEAAKAAAGWGGDRYSLLSGPAAERLLIVQIRWDSVQDSGEFFESYKTFAGIKRQEVGGTSESVGESGRRWVMPDETVFLGQIGPAILLVVGDDEKLVATGIQLVLDALTAATP